MGGGDVYESSPPTLQEYQKTHKMWGKPCLNNEDLHHLTRLILFNTQGFTVAQVWTELRASLRESSQAIKFIKHVSEANRNPHMDLWVDEGSGTALIHVIRCQHWA
jgi:hypothetical protein